jgi:hypothetical protein
MKAMPRVATTPNATTLYGTGMYDLSKEPVVITVPGPVQRLLLGPDWNGELPEGFVGADVIQATSNFAGVLARVALRDKTEEELKIVNAIQDRFTVMSLSQWLAAGRKEVRADDVPVNIADYPTYPGMETVKEPGKLSGTDFLRWVGLVLNDPSFSKQVDGHKEIEAFKRFGRLGLEAGSTFDPDKLSPEIIKAIDEGIDEAKKEVMALSEKGIGVNKNGWDFSSDLDYKDTDWLKRARYGLMAVITCQG